MPATYDQQAIMEKAKQVYEERWRAKLEASDFGKVIALEPESGDYVLGKDYLSVFTAKREKFGTKYVYIFRVGGGGAVRIGGAYLNGRIPRRNQPSVSHD